MRTGFVLKSRNWVEATFMKRLQILWTMLLVLSVSLPVSADQASAAFKRGVHAESENKFDEAFLAYSQAHELKPRDPKYFTAYTRLRFYAAMEHIKQAQALRDAGKLQEAAAEFQKAAEIDHTNFVAKEEARRTEDLIRKQARKKEEPAPPSQLDRLAGQMEGPIELVPISNNLINLRLSEQSTMVYKTIAKLAGINVLFDQDYKPQKITIELNDVTLREALNVVALQTKTFWQPTSSNTILVAADTPTKRKEMQDTVMKTFYLKNVSTSNDLQEAANTLRSILDLTKLQMIPNQNALILRGTPDQMVLAQKLIADIDKPKPEVVIDIAVLQVSRDRIKTIGVNPPTSASIVMVPGGAAGAAGGGSGGSFTLNSLGNLNATNFQVSIPGASMSMLMSDSDTKLIQNPEIRALDNEKATLKIGDRVPVATGSFGAAGGIGGVSALVNTQFQYLDVGVNIDITPHIHSENEVTLKMTLEVSSVSGTQNIGGISQPVIGQRRIEHETRLEDGEVNLVGGILEDTETHSLAGYPWLTKIPILKYLFGQEDRERQENEIVFAITPHIVRAQTVTEDNLRLVDLGPSNGVSIRYKDPRKEAANGGSGDMERTSTPKPTAKAPEQHAATPAPATMPRQSPPANVAPTAAVPVPASAPGAPSTSSAVTPDKSPQNPAARPPNQRAPSATTQAVADPCPYGQHYVGQENGVTTCAFN